MKFAIPNPCDADWDKMKIGINSRHCEQCDKSVIDFTKRTREEILAYLLMHSEERVCGHIRRSQLDFSHEEIMVVINGMTHKEKTGNLPFYILCVGAMMLTSCTNNAQTTGEMIPIEQHDTLEAPPPVGKIIVDDSNRTCDPEIMPDVIMEGELIEVIDGDIDIVEPPPLIEPKQEYDETGELKQPRKVYRFVDQMPEYPAGVDSLLYFLHKSVTYPKPDKEAGVEGIVVASFVVSKDGSLSDFKIEKSLTQNTDKEVLRVLKTMDNWIPGKLNGTFVDVRYTIPVRFHLD